ncbi:hypothetical protein [Salegentibacter sp. Hel_I_6]|uniref:hypothetical protein n=1 Tax=Salegentibacter sp. Hel_I_6 TaxID=1250278 RepID=UPI00055FFF9B|nr:hypothetical protein [Salegentibacter sp. Hel_I_6]
MKNFYILLFVFFSITINGQNYYYNGSEKIEIHFSEESYILFEEPSMTVKSGFEKTESFSRKGFFILEKKKKDFSMKEDVEQHKTQISPAYKINSDEDFKMFPTKMVRVKLRKGVEKEELFDILREGNLNGIEEKYGVLRISIKNVDKVLEIANKIYEAGIAEFSIPDFYIPKEVNQVDDPLYPLQFQLHNTGQVIDGVAGVNDIDCNAPEAWEITLGSNITVAVFDQGLEEHDDFEGRLVGGVTPANNGNGEPEVNNETHGMNCA